ncbi:MULTISPECIES: hypothetical protein [Butyricimonas]|uniref:hypothetical protein n=1 Tax=Butyricimonas TaxID=574697 RepID=UPI001D05CA3F|nr:MULTISPECIES: hypothetical protein [Butyricimonas]MCB6973919.1 hypothetical protein [Butyricimonas synergistica]MCG4520738.1 hypothetical protein [Butyricimonas sp. DFI.6.44]
MKRDIIYSLLCMLFIFITACEDEPLGEEDDFTPGAKSVVTATVEFKPLVPALNGASRTAGNAIKEISSLWMLLYSEDGMLVEKYKIEGFTETTIGRNDLTTGGPYAESKTSRAAFKRAVPQGRYYVYAVANLDLELDIYKDAIQTRDGLKGISFNWVAEDVAKNSQMFGHFSEDGKIDATDGTVLINKNTTKLYAWVRRAASKVTVAYDGTDLNENVYIYLKSVQIKDIPATCFLGKENAPDITKDKAALIKDGELIDYSEGNTTYNSNYKARITKGTPKYSSANPDKNEKDPHGETVEALYFFENMQGEGEEGTESDKRQDVSGNNSSVSYPTGGKEDDKAYKDAKPSGTYIEVRAYYVSSNEERVGSGDIVYRFMLGKDVIKDYNAERNYHYKLTLKFNKFANDVDWHIEYEEEVPGIEVPQPYYISYLYNRTMDFPLKINTAGAKLLSLDARIIFNNWAPEGASTLDYARQYDCAVTSSAENAPWNGFLSLRKTTARVLTIDPDQANEAAGVEYVGTKDNTAGNEHYYNSKERGKRSYTISEGQTEYVDDDNGNYSIKPTEGNKTVNVKIPLYTRAKQMIISTAYTGNNPYVAYQRRAEVEFTAKIKFDDERGEKILKDTAKIFQVRRVVNPKGIYRSAENTTSFHVKLMRLPKEEATEFEVFPSEGPWRAYIPEEVDGVSFEGDDFITLNGGQEVVGKTGSPIEFTVNFKGKLKEGEARHTIIRVDYHNYTCQHLIFVMQGDAPVQLVSNKAKWHTRNLVSETREAVNPLDEGSLFRFDNLEQPIAASNQVNSRTPWTNVKKEDFEDAKDKEFTIVGSEKKLLWGEIDAGTSDTSPTWKVNLGNGARIAKYEDYQALFDDANIQQGYGVLYGDEANDTRASIQDVYEYRISADGKASGYGMRGCFVYNKTNGKHVFFPVGASGYGHRRNYDYEPWGGTPFNENTNGRGVLRYASGRIDYYPNPKNNPLFYDLFRRPGAVYWLNNKVEPGSKVAWDINYFTFDFNSLDDANVFAKKGGDKKSDACFIRCVED